MFRPKIVIAKIVLLIFFLLNAAVTATAQPRPLEVLKPAIDSVIAILNNPKYKTDDQALKTQQRDQIWQTVNGIFDFEELSKRALARNWRIFNADEQKKFTTVFGGFLGNTYIDKLQGEYHNEKIVYGNEQIVDQKWALVRTKIIREALEIPFDYKMKLINGQWKVFDILVEGVSLVKNYRTQFNSLLRKEKPAQLIERLEKKSINSKKSK
jgi:phospholipid transport system substrate-binding protein